jgi:hypothetical protein
VGTLNDDRNWMSSMNAGGAPQLARPVTASSQNQKVREV